MFPERGILAVLRERSSIVSVPIANDDDDDDDDDDGGAEMMMN